ncbi:hypothetical protein GII36_03585 [Candidatus Mycosynbacter amalyticus]|uniref:HD domain-containing protein n=1 Tax=Candidatus Mycosynbacter amalyticus TaxID=2665156 RepID=A0A857MQL5_9BACT|nr:hypothetical protein [Candidatus Mycosynbacter amalyticus]QHN42920.1 hypothetical protein GII36_03585 [Candidatus Mycosynbacter amalyticus]
MKREHSVSPVEAQRSYSKTLTALLEQYPQRVVSSIGQAFVTHILDEAHYEYGGENYEYRRSYHNDGHLWEMIESSPGVADMLKLDSHSYELLLVAISLHDKFQDEQGAGENEQKSALYAMREAEARGYTETDCLRIYHAIMATVVEPNEYRYIVQQKSISAEVPPDSLTLALCVLDIQQIGMHGTERMLEHLSELAREDALEKKGIANWITDPLGVRGKLEMQQGFLAAQYNMLVEQAQYHLGDGADDFLAQARERYFASGTDAYSTALYLRKYAVMLSETIAEKVGDSSQTTVGVVCSALKAELTKRNNP